MRLTLLVLIICSAIIVNSSAQKLPIGLEAYKTWSKVGWYDLSPEGDYIAFILENVPIGNKTLIVKPTDNRWEKHYIGASFFGFIDNDNDKAILIRKADNGIIKLNLQTMVEFNDPVITLEQNRSLKHINVQKSTVNHERIIIQSSSNEKIDSIEKVSAYAVSANEHGIIFIKRSKDGKPLLYWYSLKSRNCSLIWEGNNEQRFEFISQIEQSKHIIFKVMESPMKIDPNLAEVDIWGYKDANYPSPFGLEKGRHECVYSVSSEADHRVTQLTGSNERLIAATGDFALVQCRLGNDQREAAWNESAKATYYCISIKNGTRKLVAKQTDAGLLEAKMSPNGKYIILANNNLKCYSSYDVETENVRIISKPGQITYKTIKEGIDILPFDMFWLNENYFILKDDHDLWKLDARGDKESTNLTKEVGRRENLVFQILPIAQKKRHLLLNTFDENSKNWGFYELNLLKGTVPKKLSMGKYYYGGDRPVITRARKSDTFVLFRETVGESRNLFMTKDFVTFTQLSNLNPEKDYNWMTSELVSWEGPDKRICTGILYKPEDFDSTCKYPMVVNVYNAYTHELNSFVEPDESSEKGGLYNILPTTWLVSNRYLVFIPDLNYRKINANLASSLEMVVSGVNELTKKHSYINADKIGLQRASWGGEQVNYIVTHTNLFAAAFTGAGFSEQISRSGYSDATSNNYYLPWVEGQEGGVLPQVPERYIDESALFHAGNLTTPLLIKHNKDDNAVPFYQGLQFFMLLRRLNKKAWLLQYDRGGHGINYGKNLDDFNLRVAQFFDHYLKNAPPPRWMTKGINSERKQIDSGLELDTSGVLP